MGPLAIGPRDAERTDCHFQLTRSVVGPHWEEADGREREKGIASVDLHHMEGCVVQCPVIVSP